MKNKSKFCNQKKRKEYDDFRKCEENNDCLQLKNKPKDLLNNNKTIFLGLFLFRGKRKIVNNKRLLSRSPLFSVNIENPLQCGNRSYLFYKK